MAKKQRGKGKQSLLTPISLKRVRKHIRIRAEDLYRFIKKNPNCTRNDMVARIHWADKDKVRTPLRILFTEKRIGTRDTKGYKWKFFAIDREVAWSNRLVKEGKIEERKCGGKNQQGEPCRAPDLFVREDGFCMHHGPDADKVRAKCEATRLRNQQSGENNQQRHRRLREEKHQKRVESLKIQDRVDDMFHSGNVSERPLDVPTQIASEHGIYFDGEGKMVFDKSEVTDKEVIPQYHESDNQEDGYITVRVPIPQQDTAEADELRQLIKDFLAGQASVTDLRRVTE